jgi:hypothetical protein
MGLPSLTKDANVLRTKWQILNFLKKEMRSGTLSESCLIMRDEPDERVTLVRNFGGSLEWPAPLKR